MNILTKEQYEVLQIADLCTDGLLYKRLNERGLANWTVCPECHVDDFCHVEGCSLMVEEFEG